MVLAAKSGSEEGGFPPHISTWISANPARKGGPVLGYEALAKKL